MDENNENFEIFKDWIDDLRCDLNRTTNALIHQEDYPKAAYELGCILGRLKMMSDSMESECEDEEEDVETITEAIKKATTKWLYEQKKCQSRCS